ncbi:MAG: rhomboid family intramembrane serine protease [Actinomycetota bacterium]|nr:rhomboid family intramembrane serine protease [Actinomycetota bacterium]
MIPLRDRNPTTNTPYVTIALIAVNVLVFFTEPISASNLAQAKFFYCKAAIPFEVLHGHQSFRLAATFACPDKHVWFSILYSMFLHGGFLHIAGNMLFLWVFGNNIEDRLGPVKFLLLYFGAGIAATFAQSLVAGGLADVPTRDALQPMVGASGAIAGVLGAYILLFPRARVSTLVIFFFITVVDLPAYVVLGLWFVLQVFSGVASVGATASSGVAFFAHIGGFVAGMILLAILRPRRAPPPEMPFAY